MGQEEAKAIKGMFHNASKLWAGIVAQTIYLLQKAGFEVPVQKGHRTGVS